MNLPFSKYHGLGNDYIVISPASLDADLTLDQIRAICHRNYGVGSDGILLGPLPGKSCDFGLRIFNPDGSEAEKSGNGLRIFARSLWDQKLVQSHPFTVETLGGMVTCNVAQDGKTVTVEMGQVSFDSRLIPLRGEPRQVLREQIAVGGRSFEYCAAVVGNPHCVILCDNPTAELAKHFGPLIEHEPRFPNRTNVQFMTVLDRQNIRIEIWERGAGYTLASGSSSTAAAAVAYRLGLCESHITVHVPGGELDLSFTSDFFATLHGSVAHICNGEIDSELFATARI